MSLYGTVQRLLERLRLTRKLQVERISAEQFYAEKQLRQGASHKRVASKVIQQSELFTFSKEMLRGARLKWPKGGFSAEEDDEHADKS